MLIKYKGKLFREVKAVSGSKATFRDSELAGTELVEYIEEVKNNQARNFVKAISDVVNDTLSSLSKEKELDFRDIDIAVAKAVKSFIESPSGSITDF